MIDEQAWWAVEAALPIGMVVEYVVELSAPFGIFVKIPEVPDARAVVDAISFRPGGEIVDPEQWPAPGEAFQAVVVDHVEHNCQIKLRVGPA
jgi:ribosomal protein S1